MSALKSKKTGKRVLIVTHNLNLEGAPLFLFNLAKGLKKTGYNIEILSPQGGPVEEFFQKERIKTKISDFTLNKLGISKFEKKYDVIIVNTIVGYKFIKKLNLKGEKVIWCLHESERDFYFNYFSDLNKSLLGKVTKVVFSSRATMYVYGDLNINDNFTIINTVGDYRNIFKYIRSNSKKRIKGKYGFKKTDFLINLIGTLCLRKGQLEFTEAATSILKKIDNPHLKFVMVGGGRGSGYEKVIRKTIESSGLTRQIVVFNETSEIFDFYFISDILVCNSYIEAFPMVTLEAMAFGLPIVSTDAYGLAEQFENGKNGLLVMPGDTERLEKKIMYLIKNPKVAKRLGENAKETVKKRFSFKKMIGQYNSLIQEVCNKNG